MLRYHLLIILLLVTYCCGGQTSIYSDARLASAGQVSITDNRTVMLVVSEPFSSRTVTKVENYEIRPGCKIESVAWDPALSFVLTLKLSPETPLKNAQKCEALVLGGEDYKGKLYDPYYMRGEFYEHSLQSERENILRSVLPDGAINIKQGSNPWLPTDGVRVTPYFCCIAINGLTRYAQMADNEFHDLNVCDAYLDWHQKHMNPESGYINDYHGTIDKIKNTEDFDSTDSYGAFYILAVWRQYALTNDLNILRQRWSYVELAMKAIRSTLDPTDHLTLAKPSYPVKYTMDNVEVWQGFYAASQIARVLDKRAVYEEYLSLTHQTENAIKQILWQESPAPARYVVGKDNGGKLFGDWNRYYPDGMANDFGLDMHFPTEERFERAWDATKKFFLQSGYVPNADVEFQATRIAARKGDTVARDLAWSRTLQMHEANKYSFVSGSLLELAWLEQTNIMNIPVVDDKTKIDWRKMPVLVFGNAGNRANFFDNEFVGDLSESAIYSDGVFSIRACITPKDLIVRLAAADNNLKPSDGAEGISRLVLTDNGNNKFEASALLTSGSDAQTSVGLAKVEKTPIGYNLQWALPLDKIRQVVSTDSLHINIVVSDCYENGKSQRLALSNPEAAPKHTITFGK